MRRRENGVVAVLVVDRLRLLRHPQLVLLDHRRHREARRDDQPHRAEQRERQRRGSRGDGGRRSDPTCRRRIARLDGRRGVEFHDFGRSGAARRGCEGSEQGDPARGGRVQLKRGQRSRVYLRLRRVARGHQLISQDLALTTPLLAAPHMLPPSRHRVSAECDQLIGAMATVELIAMRQAIRRFRPVPRAKPAERAPEGGAGRRRPLFRGRLQRAAADATTSSTADDTFATAASTAAARRRRTRSRACRSRSSGGTARRCPTSSPSTT